MVPDLVKSRDDPVVLNSQSAGHVLKKGLLPKPRQIPRKEAILLLAATSTKRFPRPSADTKMTVV